MGRAVECPLCRNLDLHVEEVSYQSDLWSRIPVLTVETMLALVCRRCNHVRLIRQVDEWQLEPKRS